MLPVEADVLAARFSEAGYPTAGFSTNRLVSETSAFARSFSYSTSRLAQRSVTRLVAERPLPKLLMGKLPVGVRWSIDSGDESAAARVNQQVLDWLDTTSLLAGGLVYSHYFDPHSPYAASQSSKTELNTTMRKSAIPWSR